MVVLVPRQVQISGMTGAVPYFGGRFTPAQAYAASHPQGVAPPPQRAARAARPVRDPQATLDSLDRLLADGVVSQQEYDDLRARITGA